MQALKKNKRVSLLAKLGRAPKDRVLATQVKPPEPRAARALYLRWVRSFFVLWEHVVAERLALRLDAVRADAAGPLLSFDWDQLVDQSGLPALLERVGSRVNTQVATYYGNIFRQPPPKIPREAAIVDDFRKSNIELIKNMGAEHVADLNAVLSEANAKGMRHEELADLIQKRIGVGESRAKLIARDQTLKYNSSVHTAQATAAGLTEFTWSTSHDGAVRPMHKALDGKRFAYADPPVTNEDGERNLPGEDYNCRCAAIPVIALFEGIDDEG